MYASFSENVWYDLNLNTNIQDNFRTFEELITERGESFVVNHANTTLDYNKLFDKIKSKLCQIDRTYDVDLNLFNCPSVKKYTEDILSLKRETCDAYLDYIKAESDLTIAREKYTLFCENIRSCIDSIRFSALVDQDDITVRDILEKKVENYYTTLNIDKLIENYNNKNEIFEKVKYKINLITGTILPTTICQICIENQVDFFVDPCGHTICKTCKEMVENKSNNCHYCRTSRKGYKRLYL